MNEKFRENAMKTLKEYNANPTKETATAYLESAGFDFSQEENNQEEVTEKFPYIAARLWYPDEPVTWKNLCIYTYGNQVLFGDKENADWFLGYVNRQYEGVGGPIDKSKNNPYKIYRLDFKELT